MAGTPVTMAEAAMGGGGAAWDTQDKKGSSLAFGVGYASEAALQPVHSSIGGAVCQQ